MVARDGITELFMKSVMDPSWQMTFVAGLVGCVLFQKLGEILHSRLLTQEQQSKTCKITFGSYVQGIIHAIMLFIGTIFVIHEWIMVGEYPENRLYKYISVLSTAYYCIVIFYEILIPQSLSLILVMIVHHIFCILGQLPVFYIGSVAQLLSALNFQCEISNIFMGIHWFAQQFEKRDVHYYAGLGILITYPITRIIILPIAIYKFYNLEPGTLPISYVWAVWTGEVFVVLMSTAYTFHLLFNARKVLTLKSKSA